MTAVSTLELPWFPEACVKVGFSVQLSCAASLVRSIADCTPVCRNLVWTVLRWSR